MHVKYDDCVRWVSIKRTECVSEIFKYCFRPNETCYEWNGEFFVVRFKTVIEYEIYWLLMSVSSNM